MVERWAADTSWLYALLDENDEFHAEAVGQAAESQVVLVNPVVLSETLDLIKGRAGRENSRKALDAIIKLPNVRLAGAVKTAPWSRAMANGGMSWHDASAICTALDEGAGLRTFDANQRKAFKALA